MTAEPRARPALSPPLAVVLAVAAGAADAACFTRLGQVFAGVMTATWSWRRFQYGNAWGET